MSWRVLFIEESNHLSLYLDNVKVVKGANEYLFPLSDILMIVIDNFKTNFSVGLFNACAKYNIPIILCGDNHLPYSIHLPLSGHYESAKMLNKQINYDNGRYGLVWKKIIQQKIRHQQQVIEKYNSSDTDTIELLSKYIQEVDLFDSTNREGLAAKVYFHSLFGLNFSRRDDHNVINACLDYGYSILRSLIARITVSKGLNPQLGIFHRSTTNAFNLVDDFMEPFRPIVDNYVYSNFLNEQIFLKEHRNKILRIVNFKLNTISDQKVTLNHCVEKYVDEFIKFMDGTVEELFDFGIELHDL